MSWIEGFKRAIGLKASFRRTGSSQWHIIAFGAMVGVLSGNYIFKEPLREYFEQQRELEASGSKIRASEDGRA